MCSHVCPLLVRSPCHFQLPERASSIWRCLQWSWKQVQSVCWEAGGKWGRVACGSGTVSSGDGKWVLFPAISVWRTMRFERLRVCFHRRDSQGPAAGVSPQRQESELRRWCWANMMTNVLEGGMIEWRRRGVKHRGDQLFQFSWRQLDGWTAVLE